MAFTFSTVVSVAVLAALLACGPDGNEVTFELQAHSFSDWSEPEYQGTVVSTPFRDIDPALSPDGLSLYVGSDRPGGQGGIDIWVSRRACIGCPWETPRNLDVINTPNTDGVPKFSPDGHLLFFESNRPGAHGRGDIWVSRRADPNDDFSWGPPVNLGPDVNTADIETPGSYLQSAEDGPGNLYFSRGPTVAGFDIYYAAVTRDGVTRGAAIPVAELNNPGSIDGAPTVRADGRELIFWSTRPGGLGGNDLWVSTRRSVHDPWSEPRNLGAPLNSSGGDLTPHLSHDGRTLMFSSTRPPNLGFNDIWIARRTPSGN